MTSRFQRLRMIVESALARSADERLEYVRSACEGDPDLFAEAQHLLAAPIGDMEQLLEEHVPDALQSRARAEFDPLETGDTIGPFNLLEEIGRGASGVVFRARQEAPVAREVAVKVRRTHVAGEELRRRFEAEKQVLALLEHPHLASLYDAGTTEDGRAWFAMELVRGVPITEYVASHSLGLHERLLLFIDVCAAVDHAHRKGILHRDLKPSNILVADDDGRPTVKVIDFGIARVLAGADLELSLMTVEGQALGTPQYMSPEQARGDASAVDVRSDVYSLGVVLHEILTRALPYEEIETSILGVLQRVARGDVDLRATMWNHASIPHDLRAILSVCLDPDSERRYAGARALADDLANFNGRRPVTARPPSTLYQLRMVVRRNRLATAAMGMLLMALVGAAITVSILYRDQVAALETAEVERAKSERINEFLAGVLLRIQRDVDLDLEALRSAVWEAAQPLMEAEDMGPALRADILSLVAEHASSMGERKTLADIQSASASTRIEAIRELGPALAPAFVDLEGVLRGDPVMGVSSPIAARLPRVDSDRIREQLQHLTTTLRGLAWTEWTLGEHRRARAFGLEAMAFVDQLFPDLPGEKTFLCKLLGETSRGLGDLDAAARYHGTAAELDAAQSGPRSARYATSIGLVGLIHLDRLDWRSAAQELESCVSILREVVAGEEARPIDVYNLRMMRLHLARALMGLGDDERARSLIEESVAALDARVQRENQAHALCLMALVEIRVHEGQVADAIATGERALEILADYPQETMSIAGAHVVLGQARLAAREDREAAASFGEGLDVLERADQSGSTTESASAYMGRGWARLRLGNVAQAQEDLQASVEIRRVLLGPSHWRTRAAEALLELARARGEGRPARLRTALDTLANHRVPLVSDLLIAELRAGTDGISSSD